MESEKKLRKKKASKDQKKVFIINLSEIWAMM